MTIWIGVDEAGYGPNLGPLVISATVWQTDPGAEEDVFRGLSEDRGILWAAGRGGHMVPIIGDSKRVYRRAAGIGGLERGVFGALRVAADRHGPRRNLDTWRAVWDRLDAAAATWLDSIDWYRDYDAAAPSAATQGELATIGTQLAAAFARHQVVLRTIQSKAIFPEPFNRAVELCGGKGAALTRWTLDLVADLVRTHADTPITVRCDKHGARNRYHRMLQRAFPGHRIEIERESKTESVYRWGAPERSVETRFSVRGERFLPTALASMASKLLREMAMAAFNAFWIARDSDLKPTAGYPVDAKRFRARIESIQRRLGIPDRRLWRNR